MAAYKIKDLKNGMANVDIVVTIDFLGHTNKGKVGYGESMYIQSYVKDETGEIKLTFWDTDVKGAKEGKKVKITKGYVSEYKGELQLNASEEGTIEFLK